MNPHPDWPAEAAGLRSFVVVMNHAHPSKNSPQFLLFLVCLFASAGQLAIDIYVPALPAMARYFATSPQAIQSSVSGYMAAYAIGQLVFGPIADAYGRKKVLAFGLVVFTLGCLLSLAATHSFSRSAELRHVTQPAFSRRIRALEAWLGAELVDRSPFQVREWCQQGRIAAVKADSGHGRAKGWRIPHAALERYRSRGLLPCPDPTAARRSRP